MSGFQCIILVFILVCCILPAAVYSHIVGLALVSNGPAMAGLVRLNEFTGNVTVVGPAHSELDGMGDLTAVDSASNILYYLGDTSKGTTLVGLSLDDGTEICRGSIALRELGFVGIAQSLEWDNYKNDLIIAGLNGNLTTPGHDVYRTKGCNSQGRLSKVTKVGTFGDALYAPMLHASTLDAKRQRLFVTVAPTKNTAAVGMIELDKPGAADLIVFEQDDASHTLLGMQYDSFSHSIIGVMPNTKGGIDLHSLVVDDQRNAHWNSTTLPDQQYMQLYGNEGIVSALDVANRFLYILGASTSDDSEMHLLQVDLESNIIGITPQVQGLPLGPNTLLEMNFLLSTDR